MRLHIALRRAIALTLCLTLWLSMPLGAGAQAEGDQEGAQNPIVRAIVVEGNVEVDTETILNQVQATKVGEPLDIDGLREDVFRIADLGYFESIEPELYTVDEDGVRVVFNIVEFPVVREITITVAENVVEPSRVRALLDVETGKVLNANALTESLQRLPVVSGEQLGYILQATRVELTGSDMDVLAIDVAPVRVGEIIIEGNEKTKEYVIRRELTFKPGDILEMEAIRNSLRRLGQLGYFEPIIPDFLVTDDPLVVDIHLPVTEHKTGRAAFGAGYSSRDGLVGYIEVDDTNFLGRGQQARLKWEFGGRVNMYDLGFTEPYLFGTSTSAGFNLYNRRRLERGEYTLRSTGGEVTFGRPLGQFTRGFLSLRLDNSSGEPVSGSDYEPWSNRTRSIITSLRTDTTDYLNYPTEGFRHTLSVEMAGYFLGGDTRFTKYQTSFSKYYKVGRNDQTVALRVLAGYGVGELPPQEMFRVGGSETVRGYRYGEMRGDRMLVAQAEYRFPINETIHGAVFFDLGNAWDNEAIDLTDLKRGFGVGIRFNTPLGVMRIDYGIGERGGEAYFSLGPTF
ncbi:MAG TPA: BamA/TamA family outer membrane protein [Limnochordia bacterium]|nr:BamA/TamA family outer membrane protein [Limnochordia bacterium]